MSRVPFKQLYVTITFLYIKNMTEHLVVNPLEGIFYAKALKYNIPCLKAEPFIVE